MINEKDVSKQQLLEAALSVSSELLFNRIQYTFKSITMNLE
jgi:hypothetical protein